MMGNSLDSVGNSPHTRRAPTGRGEQGNPLQGNSFNVRAALFLGTAAMAFAAPLAANAQPVPPAGASADTGIADIIVTANRRQERNQDVPIAITAFAPERLEQQGIREEQSLQASVPSLTVGPNGNGSREAQSFTIRGQGATFQASPGVVVYLNEVPLPGAITLSQQGGPGNFVDLENLQVLSGPQGTLFGRNTTGGAVLLVAKKPRNEFSGWVQGRIGNYDAREIEGALNVPIVDDKVLIRAVGAYHDRDGYTRDVVWNKNRDDTHWYSGRLGITLRPSETLENYTMIYGSKSRTNGAGFVHEGFNIEALSQLQMCAELPTSAVGGYSCDVYRAATANAKALGPRKVAFSNDIHSSIDTWGITNTTDFSVGEQLTLRNIASYQKLKLDFAYDGDGTVLQQHDVDPNRLPAPGQVVLPGAGTPVTYANTAGSSRPRDNLKQFTEELQLQGNTLDNKVTYTVGGFYYDQRPDGVQASGTILYCPAVSTGAATCQASRAAYGSSQRSKALYAQGTFDFGAVAPALDSLRLTGGFRQTWDTIKGFSGSYTPNSLTTGKCASTGEVVPLATAAQDCIYTATLKSKASTWLIGLDYKVLPDVLLFGKVSRGYKSGGFNLVAVFENTRTFKPESVTAYEAGFKADFRLMNVPFRLNASGYITDYKNIQRAGGDFNPDSFSGGAVVHNGDARIKGVELEASVRPFPGLEVGGNFSHTHARYTKYSYITNTGQRDCNGFAPAKTAVDLACLPFQYVAPYIWSIHASAEQPLGDGMGRLSFFISYSHTAGQYTDPGNLPEEQPGAFLQPFGLLNASLDWNGVLDSGFDAGLFVTNATNKLYRISNTNVFPQGSLLYQSSVYGEPRMYGLKLRYRFGAE